MKKLKNWDNKTWLSSKAYISQFNKFLKTKINFNKKSKILDIGCGRANIISALQKKYKFKNKPTGIDVVANKNIKKNIIFKRIEAIKYLKNSKEVFDLILIKQTIHFFNTKDVKKLLNLSKKHLSKKGKIFIFSLMPGKNEIPTFRKMKEKLNKSLEKDRYIIKIIKTNLQKYREGCFRFKAKISKKDYLKMLSNRYISCLLEFTDNEIRIGKEEVKLKYENNIHFYDKLKCIIYRN